VFIGSANPAGRAEDFIGGSGDDLINGDGGFDRAMTTPIDQAAAPPSLSRCSTMALFSTTRTFT